LPGEDSNDLSKSAPAVSVNAELDAAAQAATGEHGGHLS
jgi:hypothetical protein